MCEVSREIGGGVKLDKWGYGVNTCSDECIAAINAYYHQVLSYGRERSVILEAPKHDKDCVLANILAAHFLCSADPSQSPLHIQAARSRLEEATSYEKAIFDALVFLISDDRDDDVALELHFKLLRDFPRDLASLKRAQVLCFYMARPDLSLNLVQQVISHNEQEEYIHGMLAFPLLELGEMEDAKEAARKGLDINKQDCWSQHAYECRYKEAVEFMEKCSSSWGPCSSFMKTHNWWHVALCYLEGHSPIEKVVEVYDQCIWKELERHDAVSPEVYLNALGLLLRVYVRGELNFFGNRMKVLWDSVSDQLEMKEWMSQLVTEYVKAWQANWYLEWHLDVLILWALAFSGELSKADELLEGLKKKFSAMNKKKQQVMQNGILLAEALFEYGSGNDRKALELLGPDFECNGCKIIGVSDEQLDVFKEVFYCILLNTGQAIKAIEVIEKHINTRKGNPFLWRLLERGYNMAGREEEATSAGEKAKALEDAYF